MHTRRPSSTDRRDFLMKAGLGVAAAGTLLSDSLSAQASVARPLTEPEKLSRLAMACWPQRHLFKTYGRGTPDAEMTGLRKKYGEITLLDLPRWTKDFFPGVYHLDLWSDVFGDPADSAQYTETTVQMDGKPFPMRRWVPSAPASRKWLEKLASVIANEKFVTQHVSNDAPQLLADPDDAKRKEGIRVAKLWMDAAAILGAKTMRANTGTAIGRIMPGAEDHGTGLPKNEKIVVYLKKCIESFKELADYGAERRREDHHRKPLGPVRQPHEHPDHHGRGEPPLLRVHAGLLQLGARVPPLPRPRGGDALHAHARAREVPGTGGRRPRRTGTTSRRSVRILNAHRYKGTIALEWENGPMDGIEGMKWLMKEVLAAL